MTNNISKLTEEEEQLYDRQIRLWGMDSQNRLKNAKVLIIGINGVSCEVIKNLVLTGINKIGLCDELNVTDQDIDNNFLISRNAIGENRAIAAKSRTENLNPRVAVEIYNYMPVEINELSEENKLSITDYDIIVCCTSWTPSCDSNLWISLNDECRKHKKAFFAMDSFGWHGLTFIDLGLHKFVKEEVTKPGDKSNENIKLIDNIKEFNSFSDVVSINWSETRYSQKINRMPKIQFALLVVHQFVRDNRRWIKEDDKQDLWNSWTIFAEKYGLNNGFLKMDVFGECSGAGFVPVNAVLGGLVTQEIIKAISGKNEPVGNFVMFNGISCSADSTFVKLD